MLIGLLIVILRKYFFCVLFMARYAYGSRWYAVNADYMTNETKS